MTQIETQRFDSIPPALISSIKAGNCIAFVGAGFSAPALPAWDELIRKISCDPSVSDRTRKTVNSLLDSSPNTATELFDKEAAAQILEDELSAGELASILSKILKPSESPGDKIVSERKKLLEKIPFHAILTTNFDDYLKASPDSDNTYSDVLKPVARRWFNSVSWQSTEGDSLVPIMKLHGQLSDGLAIADVALSRSGYRKLLFERPDYANFLKAIFVTRTVLFLGFSFSDSYLNLLRSEVINLTRSNGSDAPIAYAIMNDITDEGCSYLVKHEGIRPIRYCTNSSNGKPTHSGFDELLSQIHQATNPETSVAKILSGQTILWLDPKTVNNDYGMNVIRTGGDGMITTVRDPDEAIRMLKSDRADFDLVITHWGYVENLNSDEKIPSSAEVLMRDMRQKNIEIPVLVFASGDHFDENRRKALALGAFEFVSTWADLFDNIEQIFKRP